MASYDFFNYIIMDNIIKLSVFKPRPSACVINFYQTLVDIKADPHRFTRATTTA